jgi:hypothetical protein
VAVTQAPRSEMKGIAVAAVAIQNETPLETHSIERVDELSYYVGKCFSRQRHGAGKRPVMRRIPKGEERRKDHFCTTAHPLDRRPRDLPYESAIRLQGQVRTMLLNCAGGKYDKSGPLHAGLHLEPGHFLEQQESVPVLHGVGPQYVGGEIAQIITALRDPTPRT